MVDINLQGCCHPKHAAAILIVVSVAPSFALAINVSVARSLKHHRVGLVTRPQTAEACVVLASRLLRRRVSFAQGHGKPEQLDAPTSAYLPNIQCRSEVDFLDESDRTRQWTSQLAAKSDDLIHRTSCQMDFDKSISEMCLSNSVKSERQAAGMVGQGRKRQHEVNMLHRARNI